MFSLITLDQGLQKEEFAGGYGFHLAVVIQNHCAALQKGLLQAWLHPMTVGFLHSFQIFPGMFVVITALLLFQLSPESEKHLEFHRTSSEQLTHEHSHY